MKAISSVDVAAIIHELQFLVGGKLSQIYHPSVTEVLLQCHAKGKYLLKVIAGKSIFITDKKETTLKPSSFCMQLRKYVGNAIIKAIEQKESERIIIITLQKENTYYLLFELFSRGNIVLIDKKNIIIGALERRTWKDRAIKQKQMYQFPKNLANWKTITEKDLYQLIKNSGKKNIATALATTLGLGGQYAQELCLLSGVPSIIETEKITQEHSKKLEASLKELRKKIKVPKGYIYENIISPFKLQTKDNPQVFPSLSQAIENIQETIIISPYKKRLSAFKRTLEKQQEAIKNQEAGIIEFTQKGEKIYENYEIFQRLLSYIQELKKTKTWQEIKEILKENKNIKNIELKNKKITVKL